jgi:hypothetical protein
MTKLSFVYCTEMYKVLKIGQKLKGKFANFTQTTSFTCQKVIITLYFKKLLFFAEN